MSAPARTHSPGPSSSGHCRSCGAKVEWLLSATTKRPAPLEVAPVGTPGNIAVNEDGEYVIVPPGQGELISHFATCPNAHTHHKEHA
jgi:hypothetical protein